MSSGRVRATILGFGGAVLVFALLFYLVGVDDLVAELSHADLRLVAVVVAATLGWLVTWSVSLRTVLSILGVPLSYLRAFYVFSGAMFANNVTPFGQAGGEPLTALLISQITDAEYERGLAAIASVDTLNFVPSITIALMGAIYYATEVTLGTNRDLALAIVAVVALAVTVPTIGYLAWQRRYEIEARGIELLTPRIQWVAKHVPRVPVPTRDGIENRINGFFRAIERIATNPRGLALALGMSALGWIFQMLGLWLSFRAIGINIPLSIALFVVPIGAIAGVTPLPGGAGGIESVLVLLLLAAPLPTVTKSAAVAAIVIFRGAVYWIPILIGGTVMAWVSVRNNAS